MHASENENGIHTISLWALLVSRLILFLLFQFVIALILNSWQASQKYWLLTATLTNFVSILLLFFLFKRENHTFLSLFRFNRLSFRKDLMLFFGLTLLIGFLSFLSNKLLSNWLWENPEMPVKLMFQPLDQWLAYILLFAFPITIAFAELATYFGYIMPRLEKKLNNKWMSLLLPVLFLSMQHCTLPFIPDINFIIYRGLVFLPFALLLGISIRLRPTLFPFFAILHGMMDFGTAMMFITI
jgi:membrane protease YdiL (CAAX protease family)